MKIAVCIKQVPDSWAEKKMVGGLLDRVNVDAVLNDLDEYAIEEALRIVEAHGGNEEGGANSITIISMGKIMHERAGKRHLLERKSSRVTRRLSTEQSAKPTVTMTAKRMLGLK